MPAPPSISEYVATMGPSGSGSTPLWQPTSVSTGTWGRLQVVIAGTDVTFFRGVPCTIESWQSQEPFGDSQAVIDFPQVLQFDTLGNVPGATVPWAGGGNDAQINVVYADGSTKTLFSGFVQIIGDYYATQNGSGTNTTNGSSHYLQVTLQGTMYQAALSIITPFFGLELENADGVADGGQLIAAALNQVQGRRWGYCAPVTTGLRMAISGSFTSCLEYVQDVLGQMLSTDGTTQWTVKYDSDSRTPSLSLKDISTVNWTVDAGAPGVDTSGLTDDETLNTNVVYGSGTTPQGVTTPFNEVFFGIATEGDPGGQTFMNTKYPSFNPNTASPYPFVSADDVITLGTSDNAPGMTQLPNGVSVLQAQLGDTVTGTYNATDEAAVEARQAAAGIQVDGIVGPQTWEVIFDVASNSGGSATVLPLYALPEVVPYLYTANGGYVVGPTGAPANNPAYDSSVLRVEAYLGMGAGITLAQAIATATSVVLRDYQASWAGTIVLTTDPHEGSRFEIKAGDNVQLNYFHGVSQLFHVNQVDVAFDTAPSIGTGAPSEQPTLQVTLTVDTAARDATTSKSMVAHEPGSPGDIVRRPNFLKRKSRLTNDTVIQFDASAGAGIVPPHAIYAGLWTVIQIPFGQLGQIAKTLYATSASITDWSTGRTGYPFYVAVFNQPITAAQIIDILGNAGDPTQVGIWEDQSVALQNAGIVIEWGGNSATSTAGTGAGLSPCGYYPSTLPQGGAVTGNFVDPDVWSYSSSQPPWLWVAEYSPSSCFIKGRFIQSVGATPG